MSLKLHSLDCTDFKRIKAIHLEFNENGFTIIGGGNKQGKTSSIEAILYALGGEAYRPQNLKREGSVEDGFIRLTFDDGMIVERSGKNASLKVIDSTGKKQGQSLLNALISKIAIDLPRFLNAPDCEKAKVLLDLLGIGEELERLDTLERDKYQERTLVGHQYEQKDKAVKELAFYADVPDEEVSSLDLTAKLSEMLQRNASTKAALARIESNKAELAKLVERGENLDSERASLDDKATAQKAQVKSNAKHRLDSIDAQIKELNRQKDLVVSEVEQQLKVIDDTVVTQKKAFDTQIRENENAIETLTDEIVKSENIDSALEDTSALEKAIQDCEATNAKIRANKERQAKVDESVALKKEYENYTAEIEDIRKRRLALLDGADLPYPGLSVKDFGKGPVVTLNGIPWSDCSGSEQLIVSAAIAFATKKDCDFVLMDKLEQFDQKSLDEFQVWLESQHKQVIATRVSTGSECSFIIEDGYVVGQEGVVIDKSPIKPSKASICKGVTEVVSERVGEGKRIIVDAAPSDAMAKAREILNRKRASIIANSSNA